MMCRFDGDDDASAEIYGCKVTAREIVRGTGNAVPDAGRRLVDVLQKKRPASRRLQRDNRSVGLTGVSLMKTSAALALVLAGGIGAATPAVAQRLPFEQSFAVNEPLSLDVSTIRGKIDVTAGEPGRIVITGAVTIRVGWDVPANAADLARNVADNPPVERDGGTVRLRPPSDPAERRAVTVSYQVQVPPDTQVLAVSESGAITVQSVSGVVTVRTQSGAIQVSRLLGPAGVTGGSGAVTADGVDGPLTVTTSSSGITARALLGNLRVRTSSGAVDATLVGTGDADVETGSSAINLRGLSGGLIARSRSGRVSLEGGPTRAWDASTGSGSVDIGLNAAASVTVDLRSRSGSVSIAGIPMQGSVSKRRAAGSIGGGGPLLRVTSGSGSVRVKATAGLT